MIDCILKYLKIGENVSTVEVENAISSRINSQEVVVYGVEIKNQEGRAGMGNFRFNRKK